MVSERRRSGTKTNVHASIHDSNGGLIDGGGQLLTGHNSNTQKHCNESKNKKPTLDLTSEIWYFSRHNANLQHKAKI
jgi:hypothetical protein